jgi:hypothetical protein
MPMTPQSRTDTIANRELRIGDLLRVKNGTAGSVLRIDLA